MAKFESENRGVAWFENSVHPALWKAGDEPSDPEIGGFVDPPTEDEPSDPEIGGFVDPPKRFVPNPITYTGSDEDYHGPGSAWFSQTYGNPRLLDHEGTNVQMYDEPDTPGGASVVKWGGPHWPFRHTTPTDGVKTYENGAQRGVVSTSDRSSGPLRQAQVIDHTHDLKREASITAGLGALGLAPQVLGYYPDAAKAPARHKRGRTDDYGEPMYGDYLGNQALHTTHAGNDGFRSAAKWHNWDRSDPEQHVNDLISLWQSGLTSMQRMHQAGYGHGNLLEFKDDHIWHNPEWNEVRFTDFGGNDSFGPNDPLYQNSSWNKPEIVENGKKMVRLRDMSGLTNTIFGLMTFGRQPERMKQFEDQARREQGISASNIVTQSAKKQARQEFLENPEEFYETMLKPQGYGTKDPEKFKKFMEALRSSMLDPTVLQNPLLFMDKGNIDYDTYEKHVRNSVSELSQARKSMKKSWFENSVHPALSKKIS
jgi:hypothetical protein